MAGTDRWLRPATFLVVFTLFTYWLWVFTHDVMTCTSSFVCAWYTPAISGLVVIVYGILASSGTDLCCIFCRKRSHQHIRAPKSKVAPSTTTSGDDRVDNDGIELGGNGPHSDLVATSIGVVHADDITSSDGSCMGNIIAACDDVNHDDGNDGNARRNRGKMQVMILMGASYALVAAIVVVVPAYTTFITAAAVTFVLSLWCAIFIFITEVCRSTRQHALWLAIFSVTAMVVSYLNRSPLQRYHYPCAATHRVLSPFSGAAGAISTDQLPWNCRYPVATTTHVTRSFEPEFQPWQIVTLDDGSTWWTGQYPFQIYQQDIPASIHCDGWGLLPLAAAKSTGNDENRFDRGHHHDDMGEWWTDLHGIRPNFEKANCLTPSELPKLGYLIPGDRWVYLFYASILIVVLSIGTRASLPMLRQHGHCLCLDWASCKDQYHNIQSQPDTL